MKKLQFLAIFLKKMLSFCLFFDSQMAIFRRVRCRWILKWRKIQRLSLSHSEKIACDNVTGGIISPWASSGSLGLSCMTVSATVQLGWVIGSSRQQQTWLKAVCVMGGHLKVWSRLLLVENVSLDMRRRSVQIVFPRDWVICAHCRRRWHYYLPKCNYESCHYYVKIGPQLDVLRKWCFYQHM